MGTYFKIITISLLSAALVSCIQGPQAPTPTATPTQQIKLNGAQVRENSAALRDAKARDAELVAEIAKLKGELSVAREEMMAMREDLDTKFKLWDKTMMGAIVQERKRLSNKNSLIKTQVWLEDSMDNLFQKIFQTGDDECRRQVLIEYYDFWKNNPVPRGVDWVFDH